MSMLLTLEIQCSYYLLREIQFKLKLGQIYLHRPRQKVGITEENECRTILAR